MTRRNRLNKFDTAGSARLIISLDPAVFLAWRLTGRSLPGYLVLNVLASCFGFGLALHLPWYLFPAAHPNTLTAQAVLLVVFCWGNPLSFMVELPVSMVVFAV